MHRIAGAVVLAVAVFTVGCGDGDDGGGGPPPPGPSGTIAEFCSTLGTTVAAKLVACEAFTQPAAADEGASTTALCNAQAAALGTSATYNAQQGATCLTAVSAASCNAFVFDDAFPGCENIATGTLANDAQCTADDACASGYCSLESACPGTCAPAPIANQPCGANGQCAAGLVCDLTGASPVCAAPQAPGGAGQPCTNTGCQSGLFCSGDGNCRAPLAANAPCTDVNDACGSGLTCAGTPATCRAPIALNGACDPNADLCAPGLFCGAGNTCVALPASGQSCAASLRCVGNAYCNASSQCAPRIAPNGACDPAVGDPGCGFALVCTPGVDPATGTCQAPAACFL